MGDDPLIPVCLPCWRREIVGLDAELLAPDPKFPEEQCAMCPRQTNHGLYLSPEADPHHYALVSAGMASRDR
jgi:hypothetical protein